MDFCIVDPQALPSWNDVARVTNEDGAEFAPPAERIAVFDNDGTLCCEQPLQIQFCFAFGRRDGRGGAWTRKTREATPRWYAFRGGVPLVDVVDAAI